MPGPMYKEVSDCFPEANLVREKAQEMSANEPKAIHYELAELKLYTELMETATMKLFSFLVSAGQTTAPTTDLRIFLKKSSS